MPNGVTVEVIGADETKRMFYQLSDLENTKIIQQISKSALKIETDAKRRAPSDVGKLRASIQTRLKRAGFEAEIYSDAAYAAPTENGAKPHFPPPSALEGWAKRHGMAGMEYIIARAISRRGLPARPFLYPAWETERPDFINGLKTILRDMEKRRA